MLEDGMREIQRSPGGTLRLGNGILENFGAGDSERADIRNLEVFDVRKPKFGKSRSRCECRKSIRVVRTG